MNNNGDTSHLGCTYIPGKNGHGNVICAGCKQNFPSYPHPVEPDVWESPEWEHHARTMQFPHHERFSCDVSREDYDDRGCESNGTKDQHAPADFLRIILGPVLEEM